MTTAAPSGTVAVAGLWARPLAESAAQAGWRVIALDLFGDADTRSASVAWRRIGDPARGAIELPLLREALHEAARASDAIGWVAGSGFEALPEALDIVVPGLPLLGMEGEAVRRVRDPEAFFAVLDRLGLEHPEVAFEAPEDGRGWLVKDAAGSGGWQVQDASFPPPPARGQAPREAGASDPGSLQRPGSPPARGRREEYSQRLQPGEPMSALFLADGQRFRLVALNRLLSTRVGERPFVYAGALGPLHDEPLARRIEQALAALVPAFGLRGLASLDFIAQGGRAWLLEINPRPSASMVLHAHAWPGGLLRAHVAALAGELPAAAAWHPSGVRGHRIVFAEQACRIPGAVAADLAHSPHCHDLPAPDAVFGAGDPVCSVSIEAADAACARASLDARARAVLDRLTACQELPA